MVRLVGVLLIVVGLASIFAKDLLWEITVFSNRLKGIKSERTEWWDTWTTIGGVFFVVVGLVALVGG